MVALLSMQSYRALQNVAIVICATVSTCACGSEETTASTGGGAGVDAGVGSDAAPPGADARPPLQDGNVSGDATLGGTSGRAVVALFGETIVGTRGGLAAVDLSSGDAVIAEPSPMVAQPYGVDLDHSRDGGPFAFVTNGLEGMIREFDLSTDPPTPTGRAAATNTAVLQGVRHRGGRVYATTGWTDDFIVWDLKTDEVTHLHLGKVLWDVDVHPTEPWVYVSNWQTDAPKTGGSIFQLDLDGNVIEEFFYADLHASYPPPLPGAPVGLEIGPDAKQLFVVNCIPTTYTYLTVFDIATDGALGSAGVHPLTVDDADPVRIADSSGVAISDDLEWVYVVADISSHFVKIDTATWTPQTIPFGAGADPRDLALTRDGQDVLIGMRHVGDLTAVHLETMTPRSVTFFGPDSVPTGVAAW